MKTGTLLFEKMIQDSQDYGSTDDHMVSRVFFSAAVGEVKFQGLSANVKQAVGGTINDELEVSFPNPLPPHFHSASVQQAAQQYYRSALSSFVGFSGPGSFRMRDNTFVIPMTAEVPLNELPSGW